MQINSTNIFAQMVAQHAAQNFCYTWQAGHCGPLTVRPFLYGLDKIDEVTLVVKEEYTKKIALEKLENVKGIAKGEP